MRLMMVALLYLACVFLMRSVLMRLFAGNGASATTTRVVTLVAICWPVWPELAGLVALIFAAKKIIASINGARQC